MILCFVSHHRRNEGLPGRVKANHKSKIKVLSSKSVITFLPKEVKLSCVSANP
jgi:hypothetical protein